MPRPNKNHEHEDELNFEHDTDSFVEHQDPETTLFNTIINDGEDVAREQFGDDKVDRALIRRGQSRSYNPISYHLG